MPYIWLQLGLFSLSRFFFMVIQRLNKLDFKSIYQDQVIRIKNVFDHFKEFFSKFYDINNHKNHSSKVQILMRLI